MLDQYNVNFDPLPATVTARFSAIVRVDGGTGTYHVMVGGTIAAVDGTDRATLSTSSLVDVQQTNLGASFANPGGQQLVKITAGHNSPTGASFIQAYHVVIG